MQTERSRLYARLDHESGSDHLIVCFNSYASPANGIQTQLENFGWLSKLGVSTLWFAEAGARSWYTAFDREINDWLTHAARQHGLRRITMLGSSCGAYASVRHALLLTGQLATPSLHLDVCAIAINPQSGFHDNLLDGIRSGLHRSGWPVAELGDNPVLPAPEDLCRSADSIATADLLEVSAFAEGSTARRPHIDVLFDAQNPIDLGFSERLGALPGAVLHPHALGLHHADGARWFWKSALFRRLVERRVAGIPALMSPAADSVNVTRARMLNLFATTPA